MRKKIIITTKSNSLNILCFTDARYYILNKLWYDNRKLTEADKLLRIVKKAASIIREDIRSVVVNNENYRSPSKKFENINEKIPNSLKFF